MNKPLCIYHGRCPDGFAGAWVFHSMFGDSMEYLPIVYGEEAPDVTDRDVFLVDFSFLADVIHTMRKRSKSITILDHHKSAQERLQEFINDPTLGVACHFDMNHSGVALAWNFLYPDQEIPRLLAYIEDIDLFRMALPNSVAISETVSSYPYAFDTLTHLVELSKTEEGYAQLLIEGEAIARAKRANVQELLRDGLRMVIGGHIVIAVNAPYYLGSDVANELAKTQFFGVAYAETKQGRKFSLRSKHPDGVDVSKIAEFYGGGGHFHASGFQMPIGWKGDRPIKMTEE